MTESPETRATEFAGFSSRAAERVYASTKRKQAIKTTLWPQRGHSTRKWSDTWTRKRQYVQPINQSRQLSGRTRVARQTVARIAERHSQYATRTLRRHLPLPSRLSRRIYGFQATLRRLSRLFQAGSHAASTAFRPLFGGSHAFSKPALAPHLRLSGHSLETLTPFPSWLWRRLSDEALTLLSSRPSCHISELLTPHIDVGHVSCARG
jgi:hypothetical protein